MELPEYTETEYEELRQALETRYEPVNPIVVQDCSWCEKDESWVPLHECRACKEFRQDGECSWCGWEKEKAAS